MADSPRHKWRSLQIGPDPKIDFRRQTPEPEATNQEWTQCELIRISYAPSVIQGPPKNAMNARPYTNCLDTIDPHAALLWIARQKDIRGGSDDR